MTARLKRAGLMILGVIVFTAFAVALQARTGVSIYATYRALCAAMCLAIIVQLRGYYLTERWPWIGLCISALINLGLFFTPLLDRPASRGEIMIFALPDAVAVLAARLATFSASDENQRAARVYMIFGLSVAVIACASLFALTLLQPAAHHGPKT